MTKNHITDHRVKLGYYGLVRWVTSDHCIDASQLIATKQWQKIAICVFIYVGTSSN